MYGVFAVVETVINFRHWKYTFSLLSSTVHIVIIVIVVIIVVVIIIIVIIIVDRYTTSICQTKKRQKDCCRKW